MAICILFRKKITFFHNRYLYTSDDLYLGNIKIVLVCQGCQTIMLGSVGFSAIEFWFFSIIQFKKNVFVMLSSREITVTLHHLITNTFSRY